MEIGLALSGGGVRAAVFHLGVIRRIADDGLLERVTAVSTVSGGRLMMATLITQSSMKWPTSEEYLSEVYGAIRTRLTTTDLFSHSAIG